MEHVGAGDRPAQAGGAWRSDRAQLADQIMFHKYVQYQFFDQWAALRRYANERGIRIIGDIPIFVAPDSADAWAAPEVFYMDDAGPDDGRRRGAARLL